MIDEVDRQDLTRAGPLCWRAGAGWLVLAGGGRWEEDETGEVDAAALGWANLDRPVALIPAAGGSTADYEALLDYYVDLGGPAGYIVPVFDAAGAQLVENRRMVEEAGVIYIADGPDTLGLARALRESPTLEAIGQAFDDGAVVIGMGAGAAAMGAWISDPQNPERAERGWGWLPEAVVAPHFEGAETAGQLRSLLELRPDNLGLGIPEQVALALGPEGQVENVGPGKVTVVVSGLEVSL